MEAYHADQDNSTHSPNVSNAHQAKVKNRDSTREAIYDIGSASGGYDCTNYAMIYPGNTSRTTESRQRPGQPLQKEGSESNPFFFEGRVSDARLTELFCMRAPTNKALFGTEETSTRRG
ncbi:hypothetical protein AC578_23 [Pseudocercospora eumusae]|uniref:Uncharacterized protein n=1 Tax=Pseudocercospora eumusae TaxID=321146 RepID=A0A139H4G8_9PEZI|nr:hypothetical protein AC578_23 [Pseudocercospora eumusae]